VRGLPNLTIRSGVMVDRVELRSGRAVGVRLASPAETIGAELVVLAAGTYASPALLIRSGVGPAADLKALGAQCQVDLPGVGQNLADHPWAPAPLPATISADGPGFQAVLTWHSTETGASDPPDLQIFAQGPFNNDGRAIAALCAALLKPHSRGRVTLRSLDPAVPPIIDLALLTDDRDLRRLMEGLQHAHRLLAMPEFDAVSDDARQRSSGLADDDLRARVWANVRTYHHPTGTCAMGPDPRHAVVDAHGRVHGTERLVVADASIMPQIPSANTNLPTIMLAERIAATLAHG
jgi:choline dehydrogenase-like flavoprotein